MKADKLTNLSIEVFGSNQVFYIQMHTVAPIMLGIGGDIHTLGIGICQPDLLINGKPVLKGNDTNH